VYKYIIFKKINESVTYPTEIHVQKSLEISGYGKFKCSNSFVVDGLTEVRRNNR